MAHEDFTNSTDMQNIFGATVEGLGLDSSEDSHKARPPFSFSSVDYHHVDNSGTTFLQFPTALPAYYPSDSAQLYDQRQTSSTLQNNISQQSSMAYLLTNFSLPNTGHGGDADLQDIRCASERSLRPLLPKKGGSDHSQSQHAAPDLESNISNNIYSSVTYNIPLPDISPKTQTQTLSNLHSRSDQAQFQTDHYHHQTPQLQHPPSSCTPSPQNRWHLCHLYRNKIYQTPYLSPSSDPTIHIIAQNAETWIPHLTNALLNTQNVKDRPNSHALKVFSTSSPPPHLLLESTSRTILLSLLDRCTYGFRAPSHFNKALKPSRDLEADKTATCEERLRNVITALMWNKRVCKDVLYEDWKIRLLVNHPLAYDREKDAQMGSNDQRKARMVEERERLKVVEGELRAVRGASGEGVQGGKRAWAGEDENGFERQRM